MNWLFKEEPSNYSFDALVKDKQTVWSGVKNPLAQKHLHAVKKGDRIFYYHTGDEGGRRIAKALGDSYPDPQDTTGKQAVVDVGPVRSSPSVTLAEIKADASFATFPLVRISRLSVMPVSDAEWSGSSRKPGSRDRSTTKNPFVISVNSVGCFRHGAAAPSHPCPQARMPQARPQAIRAISRRQITTPDQRSTTS